MQQLQKYKTDIIDIEIYQDRVLIIRDNDVSETVSELSGGQLDTSEAEAVAIQLEIPDEGLLYTIIINPKATPDILVHECVHVANMLLKNRGWRHDPDNDEPFAYLVQYIFKKAFGLFNEEAIPKDPRYSTS